MGLKKRTYSQRDRKLGGLEQQQPSSQCKRAKDSVDMFLTHESPKKRPQNAINLLKKGLKPRRRLASISSDKLGMGAEQTDNKRLSDVFDKALKSNPNQIIPKKRTICGSRQAFDEAILNRGQELENTKRPRKSHLPTPPTETPKHQVGKSHRLSEETSKRVPDMLAHPTPSAETSSCSDKTFEDEEPKQHYVPNQYKADLIAPPSRDIVGNRLSKTSKEGQLWSTNQTSSLFLRLPDNVRSLIYKYTFCGGTTSQGNTIKIAFQSYNTKKKGTKTVRVTPMFKYHCSVFNHYGNPWAMQHKQNVEITNSYTLLNGVCRQLYEETAALPYETNHIAFESHNIMVNFLLMEQRITSRQRAAIQHLLLRNELPGENMLTYLPNLKRVYLASEQTYTCESKPRGWYDVERRVGQGARLVHGKTGGIY